MPRFLRSHILLSGHTETLPYTSNQTGRNKVVPRTGINRKAHGKKVRTELLQAASEIFPPEEAEFVYVTFVSPWDFLLDLDKLSDGAGNIRLASYKEVKSVDAEGMEHRQIQAAVYLNKKAVSQFLKKIDQYIRGNTKKGNPKNQSLIANIEEVRAATLQSFWQEPELPFPHSEEVQWWEVWLSRKENETIDELKGQLADQIAGHDVEIGARRLVFPEHVVFLMRGTANMLGATLLYSDRLSELRKPKETAEVFTSFSLPEQQQWNEDLMQRVVDRRGEHNISICLLDTGVNRVNPLLAPLVDDRDLETVNPSWSRADTGGGYGHGTPMAGLSFYGDLSDVLASNVPVEIYHRLESIKLIEQGHPHDPDLYGSVTIEGVARGVIINPHHKRIACMAVTSEDLAHKGMPSSWSSAVDQILYNATGPGEADTLFFVSSGNMGPDQWLNTPLANDDCSIHDPAQAFNAITVGAYTLKDHIDLQKYPGATLLSRRGGMAPCNTTSVCWDKEWCRKPDIVMEGGNLADWNGGAIDPESLQLLSTGKGGIGQSSLTLFSHTSAATALAARFAAELYAQYPGFWPETIRALIVHSAYWTPVMLGNRRIDQLTGSQQKQLISRVGYGVPNMQRARYSANNSLTLVAQKTLKPYKKEDSRIKTDQFHLFDLPWPVEVLRELFNTEVRLTITLSYYIEPDPGNRQYGKAASYRSYGLRFKMIDRNESPDAFKARVSKEMREEDYQSEGGEDWVLGSGVRDKGSLHKDFWQGPAIELAEKNKIAVYPVGGWWKTLKKQRKYEDNMRYSLIVSIEGPDTDIDIYTPVLNQIAIPL